MTEGAGWIKAKMSGGNGGCVEMRRHGAQIEVRDSKNPTGPTLTFTRHEFECWLDGATRGEFTHLLGD